MRVVAPGGRAVEGEGPGPAGCGAVAVGARTLSESGTVGNWTRDQTELFVISKLLNCILEADEEFAYMDCQFAVGMFTLHILTLPVSPLPLFTRLMMQKRNPISNRGLVPISRTTKDSSLGYVRRHGLASDPISCKSKFANNIQQKYLFQQIPSMQPSQSRSQERTRFAPCIYRR